jgi:hypothetical protein
LLALSIFLSTSSFSFSRLFLFFVLCLVMRRSHFATPSESAADVFARFASPALDFGVPMLSGRVRAGDVMEVAGAAHWVLSEIMSQLVGGVVASSSEQRQQVALLDVQMAHDVARTMRVARELMRQRGAPENTLENTMKNTLENTLENTLQSKMEQLKVTRCNSALQLLCALRQCEETAELEAANGGQRRLVLFVDGMSNLFWPNKQVGKGK